MFVRISKNKNKYVQLVESYRKNGKPTHRVIAHLGSLDYLVDNGLENIVNYLSRFVKNKPDNRKDISTMKEKARKNYGWIVYKELWNKYKLSNFFNNISKNRKFEYNLNSLIFSQVVNRLTTPSSRLSMFQSKDKIYKFNDDIKLHDIYRSLDVLSDYKEDLEKHLYEERKNKKGGLELDIVFYDVTTYYFESQKSDELRDFGFSKDKKVNEVQVVMGLLIDKDGRPVTYELFKGNTFDSKTMLKILKGLKKKFDLKKIIIVADKGLNSGINLKEIKEHGFDYIVSSRIKNMKKSVQEEILSMKDYEYFGSKEEFRFKTIPYTNIVKYKEEGKIKKIALSEQLVCTYSSKRAQKDYKDRARQLEKAMKIISTNNRSVLTQKGYKKYIKEEKKQELSSLKLDYQRIEKESEFDGYYAIQSSSKELTAEEIISRYHYLFRIEESFRVMKSTMKTRPVFLWNPKRIESHFIICFISLFLERELEYRLNRRNVKNSPEEIKKAINSMNFSEIEIEGEIYYLKSNQEKLASSIMRILQIKHPENISKKEISDQYIEKFLK